METPPRNARVDYVPIRIRLTRTYPDISTSKQPNTNHDLWKSYLHKRTDITSYLNLADLNLLRTLFTLGKLGMQAKKIFPEAG